MSTTDISSGITNDVGVECVMTVHVYELHDIFGKKKTQQIIKQHTVRS